MCIALIQPRRLTGHKTPTYLPSIYKQKKLFLFFIFLMMVMKKKKKGGKGIGLFTRFSVFWLFWGRDRDKRNK